MAKFDWIVNKLKQRIYPYTHADAVIMDDSDKKLTETLDEVNKKIEGLNFSQSDWNETNQEQVAYIKNKPDSLPASGGNSDTLDGKHAEDFALASDFNVHKSSADSHQPLFNKKLDIETANSLFKDISFNSENGLITITRLNNTVTTIDLPVELLLKSGNFDNETKEIVLVLKDNSEIRIPAEALVDIYTGKENDVIQILVDNDNIISAVVKAGSITKSLFSFDIQALLNSLENKEHGHSNKDLLDSISNEVISKINSSYTHTLDTLKHLPDDGEVGQVLTKSEIGHKWTTFDTNSGISNYSELMNKPKINGVELNGDKLLSDLGISATSIGAEELGSSLETLNQAKQYTDEIGNSKVDKVDGKQLSTNDYTTVEKEKLAGIAIGANNYSHPTTHPAAMIIEDDIHQFVTIEEKAKISSGSNTTSELILKNQELSFTNLTCSITNSEIKASSLAYVFFDDNTAVYAETSRVTCQTIDGAIKFTAVSAPYKNLIATIIIN